MDYTIILKTSRSPNTHLSTFLPVRLKPLLIPLRNSKLAVTPQHVDPPATHLVPASIAPSIIDKYLPTYPNPSSFRIYPSPNYPTYYNLLQGPKHTHPPISDEKKNQSRDAGQDKDRVRSTNGLSRPRRQASPNTIPPQPASNI